MARAAPRPARPAWLETAVAQGLALFSAFAFAGIAGALIITAYGESPLKVYDTIWQFGTSRPQDFARVLVGATPLIFSALAVAVAFKAGMFNIGVEGQYLIGMLGATATAVTLDSLPAVVLLPLVMGGAMVSSMAWAAIPAILKVRTGAHEVVTTIMMNGIAVSLIAWALRNPLKTSDTGLVDLRSDRFVEGALVPDLPASLGLSDQIPGSVHLSWLLPLAVVACFLVWYFLFRTRLGYESRAVGMAQGSAQAGGVSIGATQVKVFLISGALAGFVGLNHLLADKGFLGLNYQSGLGFTGIAVAFLGRNHPIGIPLAAILFGMLNRGESGIQILTDLPREIIIILQGLLILSVVVAYELVRRGLSRRRQQRLRAEEDVREAHA